ncbi:MAG: DUF4890 domain-containing protein [Crocinitomicaceae bacterium]|nr:DUF4890 domain-containing protein [Crocinitomicaceae bacterium]
MKKIAVLVLMIGTITVGFAQGGPGGPGGPDREKFKDMSPEERAEKRTEKMAEMLDLTADQKEKILKLNLEHAKEMESIKAEGEKLKEKAKNERDSNKKAVESILTDEQKKILEEKEKEREEKRKEHCKCCNHE